jgi:2-desacetyl-2-hydroxyethyl bacteriochlorophyllide A dehydrogenase
MVEGPRPARAISRPDAQQSGIGRLEKDTMKAQRLVFPEANRCEIETIDVADKPEAGKVLVRNIVSVISPGTELALYCGTHRAINIPENKWAKYPFRPGYCALGEVLADAGGFKAGDKILHAGPHATYSQIDPNYFALKAVAGLEDELVPFLRLLQVSMTAIRLAPVKMGERVLVIGMGIIGNFAAQLYNQCGAADVIGSERSAGRIDRAGQCGIAPVFNVAEKPLADWFSQSKTPAPELVIEAIGLAATITESFKVVKPRGRVVLLGSPRKVQEFDPYFDIHAKGTTLIGAHGNWYDAETQKADAPFLMGWIKSGKIKVKPLITHRVSLSEAMNIYPGLRDHPEDYMGVVIRY